MSVKRIDSLIETARDAMNNDLDIRTVYRWKKEAVECLVEHLGADHYYTRCFIDHMEEIEQKHLLTGTGVLTAVREQMSE